MSKVAESNSPRLMYMGQASIRIITKEGKVIYIDPYAGTTEQYAPSADLILVTHAHFDHAALDKIKNRSKDCKIITQKEALRGGVHQSFDLGFVKVEAVEAGYNRNHYVRECVGYVLIFAGGESVYVTGDTSKTKQMLLLSEKHIDYAFFCTDGVFNMGNEEATECARLVNAKHNIPYHNSTSINGATFDRTKAEKFNAPNRLILNIGDEIELVKSVYRGTNVKQSELTIEEKEVYASYEAINNAMIQKDRAAMEHYFDKDLIFTHMSGKQQTREEFINEILDGTLNYYKITTKDFTIQVNGDTAVMSVTHTLDAKVYGIKGSWTMSGKSTYKKRNGIWVRVA